MTGPTGEPFGGASGQPWETECAEGPGQPTRTRSDTCRPLDSQVHSRQQRDHHTRRQKTKKHTRCLNRHLSKSGRLGAHFLCMQCVCPREAVGHITVAHQCYTCPPETFGHKLQSDISRQGSQCARIQRARLVQTLALASRKACKHAICVPAGSHCAHVHSTSMLEHKLQADVGRYGDLCSRVQGTRFAQTLTLASDKARKAGQHCALYLVPLAQTDFAT